MQKIYDAIIIGVGAMGSSSLYHLSKSGLNILGIDRFEPPHNMGSSYGETRIIREAYFEHPLYVPLIQKAYTLWEELERESGETLFKQTGGLMLGSPESETVKGSELSAKTHNLNYEKLDAQNITESGFFKVQDNSTLGILESKAGILFPEKCIHENIRLAKHNGAEILNNTKVINWEQKEDYISVITDKGNFNSKKIIISAGAWIKDLIKVDLPVQVSRETLFWIEDNDNNLKDCPVYIWEYEKDRIFYGFPTLENKAKIAFHHQNNITEPDKLNREISEDEKEKILSIAHKYLNLTGKVVRQEVCMYTNTPDHHFIIDYHDNNKNIVVLSPCSGHGFKFSSVIGKIASDMLLEKDVSDMIEPFGIERLK